MNTNSTYIQRGVSSPVKSEKGEGVAVLHFVFLDIKKVIEVRIVYV